MISKASSFLGENDSKVNSAVSSMIPGMLGALLKKGDTPQVKNTTRRCRPLVLYSQTGKHLLGQTQLPNSRASVISSSMPSWAVKQVLSTLAVASQSGISTSSASKSSLQCCLPLLQHSSANNMVNNNMSPLDAHGNTRAAEKGKFMNMIPAGPYQLTRTERL